jgi:hypothetical protein
MKRRNQCRLHLEELEQRAVPAALTGRHPFSAGFTGQLLGVQSLLGSISSGSGQVTADLTFTTVKPKSLSSFFKGATVSFSGGLTPESLTSYSAHGNLTINAPAGMIATTNNMGNVTITSLSLTGGGTFSDTGSFTSTGSTGKFRNVSGTFTINGTFTIADQSATGTITGVIIGGKTPKGHHH